MRLLPAALTISAVLHTAALAWVHTRPRPKPEPPQLVTIEPIQIVPVSPVDPAPMTVALLDDHTVVPRERGRGRERGRERNPDRAAIRARASESATETSPTTTEPPPPTTTSTTTGKSLMTMRHPELDKGPSSDFIGRFLDHSKPLPKHEIAGEQLQTDIDAAESNLKNSRWVATHSPEQVHAERMALAGLRDAQRTAELQPDGAGKKAEHQTFRVRVAADGTAKIEDKANLQRKGWLGGSFDVSDYMMRRQGIDPYSSYKLKVLDETRDERVAIGKRHRTQQLAQSRQHMQKNLERVLATAPDPATLKQGLFELWDDCAETGSDEQVVAGRSAREHLVGFIRTRLPSGSADAFTAAELARMNKLRKSQATFAPYD